MKKYPIDYMLRVKPREISWNEKLSQRGISTWEQMLLEAKAI